MSDQLADNDHAYPASASKRRMWRSLPFALLLSLLWLVPSALPAYASATRATALPQSPDLPTGFAKTQLAHGLKNPTVLAFAPNGDIYIGEQAGIVLIYRNGAVLPTPVVTLNADGSGEKGLLGLALDPNFASNGYMYVSYTTPGTVEYAQLSRLTVQNGVASLASEKIIMKGNQAQNLHHSANDLKIGPDGKLWWSVGDNVPAITNGETLDNIYGKILRFNLDGTIPSDNPFINVPGAVPAIYAYGLRNPFRFSFLPNGKAITEDTGSNYWEELDTIQPGGNYGWDFVEGDCGSCGYINPVYAYGHIPTDGAASAITAYSGTTFPTQYSHVVFFGDYNRNDIEAVNFDSTYTTEISDTVFDSKAGTIADMVEGPDGNLYYVSIFEGTFTEVSTTTPAPPTAAATATPNAGLASLPVQFSSAGSSDAYGLPLTYSWNFGDGSAVSTAANPSHTYTTNGTYTATLTVSNGSQTGTSTTQVVVGSTAPTVSITAPTVSTTYNGGSTITYSGTATDAVDGTLAATAYTWKADFYSNGFAKPFYTDEVAHPYYTATGVTGGTFQIPTDLSNTATTFYRITLDVVNSKGLHTVVTRDIHPNLTNWTVKTNVAGAAYVVDGTWHTGTYTTQDVVGVQHVLMGVPAQTIGGVKYRFVGWSDGSALSDSFANPAANTTYTAMYDAVGAVPSAWTSVDVGAPLLPGTADYSATDKTFFLDGTGADVYAANDQFHYVEQTLNGDGTIVARVRYQSESSPWAKAGLMIKQSTTAGDPFVDVLVTPNVSPNTPNTNGVGCTPNGCDSPLPPVTPTVGYGLRMQYTNSGSKSVATPIAGFSFPNEWLKLQRVGNTFTSWYSTDGQTWNEVGSTSVAMNAQVTIGLFSTSHNIGQPSNVAFDNVQVTGPMSNPLPSPWADTDIGAPAIGGSASYANGVFTVNGAGADIWGTSDQFNYAYQPFNGDGTLIARVTSVSNTSSNVKAGIMFKQSTTAGDPYFMISSNAAGVIKVQYNFNGSIGGGTYTFPNGWMKITRVGNVFNAYVSGDGVTWTPVLQKTLTINANATAGLFITSHNVNALGTATFDNVSLN